MNNLKDFIDLDEAYQGKYNGCSISDLEQAIAQTGTLTMTAGDEVKYINSKIYNNP